MIYEVEACEIPQTPGSSKMVWFVDRVEGRRRKNVAQFDTESEANRWASAMNGGGRRAVHIPTNRILLIWDSTTEGEVIAIVDGRMQDFPRTEFRMEG